MGIHHWQCLFTGCPGRGLLAALGQGCNGASPSRVDVGPQSRVETSLVWVWLRVGEGEEAALPCKPWALL
jgi:hypothetical protein